MRSQTFTEQGATITVRAETIEDALDVDMLSYQMGAGTTAKEIYKRTQFLRLVQTSTVDGDLGFDWPSPDASAEALLAAYEAWKQQPASLIRRWALAIEAVNASPNDPDLTPNTS